MGFFLSSKKLAFRGCCFEAAAGALQAERASAELGQACGYALESHSVHAVLLQNRTVGFTAAWPACPRLPNRTVAVKVVFLFL